MRKSIIVLFALAIFVIATIVLSSYFSYKIDIANKTPTPVFDTTATEFDDYDENNKEYRIHRINNKNIELYILHNISSEITIYLYVRGVKFENEGSIDVKFEGDDTWQSYEFTEPSQSNASIIYLYDDGEFLSKWNHSKYAFFKINDKIILLNKPI